MTVWSSPIIGSLLPPSCLRTGHSRKTNRKSEYTDFIFCGSVADGGSLTTPDLVASIIGNVATGAAAAFLTGTNPVMPIAMACIPIIVPMSISPLGGGASSAALSLLSEDAKGFVKGITYVSIGQGTMAIFDVVFGDLLAGFMKALFAGLGFYLTTMEDGVSILPSYTVVSFVNGCIMMLSTLERLSSRRTPLFSGLMPLYLNYIHLTQILHPLLCFGGAYMGWQVIKELRRTGVFQSVTATPIGPAERPPDVGRVLSNSNNSGSSFAPFSGTGRSLSQMTNSTAPASTN